MIDKKTENKMNDKKIYTYRLSIRYEGTRYKGWQRLKTSDVTIQAKLEHVLTTLFEEPIEIHGSGRTDAGVHATEQIASFTSNKCLEVDELKKRMNQYLPEDIVIMNVSLEASGFHARFKAKSKLYTYQLWVGDTPPVFERNFVAMHTGAPLDIEIMKQAALSVMGTHDFKGFSTDKTKKSTVRTIEKINITKMEDCIRFEFWGDGFLYNMVRIIVGTLIEIGSGKRSIESIETVFKEGKRETAGETAPAKGLFLTKVFYE